MPDEVQQILRVKELRLVDAAGKDRAILTTGADGTVSLSLTDSAENTRVHVGVGPGGEARVSVGRHTPEGVSVTVAPDGRILIEGTDTEGIERFHLDMKGNGSHTELAFSERHRKPRLVIIAEDKGPAGLFILDQFGKALFSTAP